MANSTIRDMFIRLTSSKNAATDGGGRSKAEGQNSGPASVPTDGPSRNASRRRHNAEGSSSNASWSDSGHINRGNTYANHGYFDGNRPFFNPTKADDVNNRPGEATTAASSDPDNQRTSEMCNSSSAYEEKICEEKETLTPSTSRHPQYEEDQNEKIPFTPTRDIRESLIAVESEEFSEPDWTKHPRDRYTLDMDLRQPDNDLPESIPEEAHLQSEYSGDLPTPPPETLCTNWFPPWISWSTGVPEDAEGPFSRKSSGASSFSNRSTAKKKTLGRFRGSTEPKEKPRLLDDNLEFRFSASGETVLFWRAKAHCLIRVVLSPNVKHLLEGQKLSLGLLPTKAGFLVTPSADDVAVRHVAGGNRATAAVVSRPDDHGSIGGYLDQLMFFDQRGMRSTAPLRYRFQPPLNLAVSRDDSRVAVACEGRVHVYAVAPGGALQPAPSLVVSAPATSERWIQTVGFSRGSTVPGSTTRRPTMLVSAAQVCVGRQGHRGREQSCPVHVAVHDVSVPNIDIEVYRSVMDLETQGEGMSITGAFYLSPQAPLLLTTDVTNSSAILFRAGTRLLNLRKRLRNPIHVAVQAPGESPVILVRGDRQEIHEINVLAHTPSRKIADLSKEGIKNDAMQFSVSDRGVVQVLWRSSKGKLLLKRISLNGESLPLVDLDLSCIYWEIIDRG